MKDIIIAIDAMGGDHGPDMTVAAAGLAVSRFADTEFILFGDEERLKPLVEKQAGLAERCRIVHADSSISSDEKPSQAVRKGRSSSMGLAIRAVKDGKASVAVSAGNTGALMALSKITLRTMRDIDRPALASVMPTARGGSVMLDLGANVECSEQNLVEFAVMGAAFARTVLGLEKPTVGLLNIGVEELKGHEFVKKAGAILKEAPLPMEFAGYIEGDGIGKGVVDVVVTDGFTGNIALKTAEGTANLIATLLRKSFRKSWRSRIGYFLARPGLKVLRQHLNPNNHNGAVFLGLSGLVVKSHGGADVKGFANAISVAHEMALNDLVDLIDRDLHTSGWNPRELAALGEGA